MKNLLIRLFLSKQAGLEQLAENLAVEKLTQDNLRLQSGYLTLITDLDVYLLQNDTEGFGCACTPVTKCGPCRRSNLMAPLIRIVVKAKTSEPVVGELASKFSRAEAQESRVDSLLRTIISDEEIERVHGNANFGTMAKRAVVNSAVLKGASGYHQGHTSMAIAVEHGLLTNSNKLTKKGQEYLWACYSKTASEEV